MRARIATGNSNFGTDPRDAVTYPRGMSMMHPARGGGMRDERALRERNRDAPEIPHLWRRIGELFAPYRATLILAVVLVLITAALGVAPALLTQQAFDVGLFPPGASEPNLGALWWIVAAMVAVLVLNAAITVWQTWLTATIGNSVTADLRVRLFERLQSMELAFFARTKTGEIQSRLQNDVGGVANTLQNTLTSVVGNIVATIASLVAMVLLSWQLAIIAIIVMPPLVVLQRRVGQRRARIATRTQASLSEMTAMTQEQLSVSGVLLTKTLGREREAAAAYRQANRTQVRLQLDQAMAGQTFFAMVSVIMALVPVLIYVVSGYLLQSGSALSAGTIVAFTTVNGQLRRPLLGLMRTGLDIQTSASLFARIFEYLLLEPAVVDAPDAVAPDRERIGEIAFRNVSFRYPDTCEEDEPTLKDVSFAVHPGEYVAVVGPSGAGKSTIAYLAARLYDVSAGVVEFAGVDVRRCQREVIVANIGMVSQETYLVHDTIAANLRLARPDASDEQLIAACKKASIHEQIMTFPQGYDTIVGERGYRLSGGEKQRIAIARVLLKDPAVLILDEATSALDAVSERHVQAALDAARRGRTVIAIAHRLSTVRTADVIHVLDRGRIVERGIHEELLAAAGTYAALYAESVSSQPHDS